MLAVIASCLVNSGLRYKSKDAFAIKARFLRSNTATLLHPEEGPRYMK